MNEEAKHKGKNKYAGKMPSDEYLKRQEKKEKRREKILAEGKAGKSSNKVKPILKKDKQIAKSSETGTEPTAANEEEDSDRGSLTYYQKKGICGQLTDVIPAGMIAAAVRRLELTSSQITKIYKAFKKIDDDGSGSVDMPEFFKMINTLDTKFMRILVDKMVFDMVDMDNNGELDFYEFLFASCLVCSFSKKELLQFIFETFDEDNSGIISADELRSLVDAILTMGSALFPSDFMSVMNSFDANGDGGIDMKEFVEMSQKYPVLFFPAMRMQDTFQRKTLGDAWIKIEERYQKKEYERVGGDVSKMMSLRANLNADFAQRRKT